MTIEQLHKFAANRGLEVYDFPMRDLHAVSLRGGHIAIDRRKCSSDTEYKCLLAHEIGHCLTNSFYRYGDHAHTIELNERHANRYAAELLLPLSELLRVMHRGILFAHVLARMYDVTREFAEMVLELYEHELCSAARVWSAEMNSR